MQLFTDPLHDEFAWAAMAYVTADAADVGEVIALAGLFPPDGDDAAFYNLWAGAGDRHLTCADEAVAGGHEVTARGHLMRAAACYSVAIKPWFGTPVDHRMTEGFDRCMAAFDRAIVMGPRPAELLAIPFDGYEMPGWFVPAVDSGPGDARPVVIVVSGYDGTLPDNYFGIGKAASERGYHVALFDGPGQGAVLVHHGIPMVANWERVITAAVDVLVRRDDVDPDRIALNGWSLAGYLAPRAASGEHRIAAVVADPALWGIVDGMRGLVSALGFPELADGLPELPDEAAAQLKEIIQRDRALDWRVVKRAFWVHGVDDLQGYLRAASDFTLDGRAEQIRCPLLGTHAENDPLARGAHAFMDRIQGPKRLVDFFAAQGAGSHCEIENRWLSNTTALDWLDEVLA